MTVQLTPTVFRTQGAETVVHANGFENGLPTPSSATPSFESALLAMEQRESELFQYRLGMAGLGMVQEGQTSLMRLRNSMTLAVAECYWMPGLQRSLAPAPRAGLKLAPALPALKNRLALRTSSNHSAEAMPNRANQDLLRSTLWAALSLKLQSAPQRSEWADPLISMRQS